MSGEIWFDNVSVEIPIELPWNEIPGVDFTHYWLDKPYPDGSIDYQQRLYEYYAARLEIPPENRTSIYYYFYPDSASIREALGLNRRVLYVDYRRRQIHSIDPVDNHEVIHMLTDPYGVLPKILSEGTAFYLMDDFGGRPIHPSAQALLRAGEMPPLEALLDPTALNRSRPSVFAPAAASFVGYLIEVGGPGKFLELHGATQADMGYHGFSQAFEAVYGRKLADAEAAWHRVLAAADFSEPDAEEGE